MHTLHLPYPEFVMIHEQESLFMVNCCRKTFLKMVFSSTQRRLDTVMWHMRTYNL